MQLLYSCSTGSIQAALRKLVASSYVTIEDVKGNGRMKKDVPEEYKDVFQYQLLTVKYGRDSAAFQIKWFENTMNLQRLVHFSSE